MNVLHWRECLPCANSRIIMSYDVVIIGGSLAGAATATLLLRECPDLRVLVIERAPHFTRRVGEATVEISGYFLGRVLGLTHHLNNEHLIKQGGCASGLLVGRRRSLADSSEIGPKYHVRLPSWQLDRAVVDEEALRRAVAAEGRAAPATGASDSTVRLSPGGGAGGRSEDAGRDPETIRCRWVVDASGFAAALLARQEGWLEPNTAHPTASAWARWRNVKDWDGRELAEKFPACGRGVASARAIRRRITWWAMAGGVGGFR